MSAAATKATSNARELPGRRDWRPKFLEAFTTEGTVTAAAKIAGVSRQHVYRERQANEDFALDWHDVEETVTDHLETKAVEVALEGDTRMLEFLLKARRPERYRDNVRVEHSGHIRRDVTGLSDEELRELADDLTAHTT